MKNSDINALIEQLDAQATDAVRTRFAPSPNGYLHQGHALSARLNQSFAQRHNGQYRLRIEDIDAGRSRPEYIESIIDDLHWLGLHWDGDIIYQSARIDSYQKAFDTLKSMGLLYPCFCTRSEIQAALKDAPVKHGPDGPHYPGTCRNINSRGISSKGAEYDEKRLEKEPHCWRLDMAKALRDAPLLRWHDMEHGAQLADPSIFGDVVIWRKDAPASYHLAATCDDAADGISHVIRGMDLFAYTGLHRLLQYLLGLDAPIYWHHGLIMDSDGEKLSKSSGSIAISEKRKLGVSVKEVLKFSL